MMPRYRVRYFFEWMTPTCLWSANESARSAFGYPINPAVLPLSADTVNQIGRLCAWHDGALNWEYPPDPGPWRQDECDRFNEAARALLQTLKHELGSESEVIDEYCEEREDPDLDAYLKNPKGFRRP